MKKLSLILLTSLMAVPLAHGSNSQLNLGALVAKAEQEKKATPQRQQTSATSAAAAPIQISQPRQTTSTPSVGLLSTSPSQGLAHALPTKPASAATAAVAAAVQTGPSTKTVQEGVATIENIKNAETPKKIDPAETQTLILNSMRNTNKANYNARLKESERTSSFINHFNNFNQEELTQALNLKPHLPSNLGLRNGKDQIKQITEALNQNILTYGYYRSATKKTHKRSDVFGKHTDPYATETESGSSRPAVGYSILDGYPLSLDQIADKDLEGHRTNTIKAALTVLEKLAKPRYIQESNAPELIKLKNEIERLKGVIFSQNTSEASKEAAKRELEKTTREYAGLLGKEQAATQERDLKHKLIAEMRNQTWNTYWVTSDKVKRFLPIIYTLAHEQQEQEAQTKLKDLISKLEQDEQQPKAQNVVIATEKRFGKPCTPWFLDLRAKEPKKAILTAESNTDTLYDLSRIDNAPTKLSDVYKKRLEQTPKKKDYATWKKERDAELAKRTLAAAAAGSTEIIPKQ